MDADDLNSSSESSSDESMSEEDTKDIENFRKKIIQNDLDYDAHIGLIQVLQKVGELEETRKAREHMNKNYPLSPDLWMDWLSNEQKVCATDEERTYIENLFEKAVKEYMSVKIWVEYIMFMLGGGEQEKTRSVCDRALTAVGIHLAEGELVWQSTYLVEQQFYVAIVSQADEKLIADQKKRIQNLFRRQSRVALMNIDKQEFMDEATKWFDESKVDPNIKTELNKSYKKMMEKLPFEEALLKAEDETAKLEAYRKYLDLVRAKDNPSVIQNVYERTVTDLCLNAGIWEEYVRFVMEQFSFAEYAVLPVCERSQLNCPWSGTLCELHITALQRFQETLGEAETDRKITEALQRILKSSIIIGAELVKSWMAYLVYLRMKIDWEKEHQKPLRIFREECKTAQNFIDLRCGEEGDAECEIARFQAHIEASCAKNMEGARTLWNENIMKTNQNFKNANLWIEFINLERNYGTQAYTRKLFRRALERVWDMVEVIGNAYLRFEQQVGDLISMGEYEQKCRDRLAIVLKKRLESATKEQNEKDKIKKQYKQKESPKPQNMKVNKRIQKVPEKKLVPSQESVSFKGPPKKNELPKVAPPPGYKRKAETDDNTSPSKKPRVDDSHGEFVKHDSKLDIRSVFLSNMDYVTENAEILPIFIDCGEVENLRITRDFKGRSKGFGYLVFKDADSVEKALKLDRTPIKDRPLFISRCNPHERDHAFKFSTNMEKNKLFIRGLPFSMKEDDIRKEFEPHGKIKSLRLVTHRNGYSKGNCYIDYDDDQTAANVLKAMNGVVIQDLTISVFISNPSAPPKSNESSFTSSVTQPGPSRTTQRTRVSFMPRALMRKAADDSSNAKSNGGTENKDKAMSNQDFRNLLLNK